MALSTSKDVLDGLQRSQLVDSRGVSYTDFRRTLKPRYALVWFHVGCGYLALGASAAAVAFLERALPVLGAPLVFIGGAAAIGFWVHFLHLFMHEGAHYNLAPNRKWNDWFANLLIGPLVGMHMKPYRPTHFDHHRHLGTPDDTEISYFDPLNTRFILESMLGIRIFKTVINWNKTHDVKGIQNNVREGCLAYRALVVSGMLHISITALWTWFGYYATAAAWFVGVFAVYPFLAALRTLLEHRNEEASKTMDYRRVPHGAVNRIFEDGFLASTFGNAGFNRHVLHHWDRQVSYTRLRDLERFLIDTVPGRAVLDAHRTTYAASFATLYNR